MPVCQHAGPLFCWWKPDSNFQTGLHKLQESRSGSSLSQSQRTLMSYLQPVSSLPLADGTSSPKAKFSARHNPSTAGSPTATQLLRGSCDMVWNWNLQPVGCWGTILITAKDITPEYKRREEGQEKKMLFIFHSQRQKNVILIITF